MYSMLFYVKEQREDLKVYVYWLIFTNRNLGKPSPETVKLVTYKARQELG